MWVCQTCKQEIEDSFDTCWKCYEGSDTEKEDLERAKKETEQLIISSHERSGTHFLMNSIES